MKMDKATTSAILGTILGLAAGVGGMMLFGPARDDGRAEELALRVSQMQHQLDDHVSDRDELAAQLAAARLEADANRSFAEDVARLSREKAEEQQRADALQTRLDAQQSDGGEERRQLAARVERLEKLLMDNGIYDFLTDEEIAEHRSRLAAEFETAFAGRNKRGALDALWKIQALGPRAYDTAIELWSKVAHDFGMGENWSRGPGTLGLTFQEFTSLITQWGLIEKGLTDPNVDDTFRINAIYAAPWWSSEDASKRSRLVGSILLTSSGADTRAATEALRDIDDPLTVQFLADYVAQNRDNPQGRIFAITILAGKNTDAAWAAIADAAQHDSDESVRQHAQAQLDARHVTVAGVRITTVVAESQAALAGIKVGDIVTHYNGVRVKTIQEIVSERDKVGPEESVKVVVRRGTEDLTLTLGPGQIGINGVAVAPKE
jgi:hypothetical protein